MKKYAKGNGRGYDQKLNKKNIEAAGGKCQECGRTKHINIHHIDKNPRNNEPDNVQVLCRSCHVRHHWKGRKIFKKRSDGSKYHHAKNRIRRERDRRIAFMKKFGTAKYYTAEDICKIEGVSRQRIQQVREEGKLEFLKYGGRYFYFNTSWTKEKLGRKRKTTICREKT